MTRAKRIHKPRPRVKVNEGTATCGDPSATAYSKGCCCAACKAINATRSRKWRRSSGMVGKGAADPWTSGMPGDDVGDDEMTITLEQWHRDNRVVDIASEGW